LADWAQQPWRHHLDRSSKLTTIITCGTGNKPEPTQSSKILVQRSPTSPLQSPINKTSDKSQLEQQTPQCSTNHAWPSNYVVAINQKHLDICTTTKHTQRLQHVQTKTDNPTRRVQDRNAETGPVQTHDTQAVSDQTIVIGITSKQWGAWADFRWCTTYQGNNQEHLLGSRAGLVMITSSYNDRTRADLHAQSPIDCSCTYSEDRDPQPKMATEQELGHSKQHHAQHPHPPTELVHGPRRQPSTSIHTSNSQYLHHRI
jgi:hypothetical protein